MNEIINNSSILRKVREWAASPAGKKRREEAVQKIMLGEVKLGVKTSQQNGGKMIKTPDQAADEFVKVFMETLKKHAGTDYAGGDLGATAIESIKLEHSTPKKVGNRYYVDVWFVGNLHRESLDPGLYGGVDNIIALLNKGYPKIRSVYGIWEGHSSEPIKSLTERSGAHFIEEAVSDFMSKYGNEYGVMDIEISNEYTD